MLVKSLAKSLVIQVLINDIQIQWLESRCIAESREGVLDWRLNFCLANDRMISYFFLLVGRLVL